MKRLIALLLCLLCCFSLLFVSCDSILGGDESSDGSESSSSTPGDTSGDIPTDETNPEGEIVKLNGQTPEELYAASQEVLKNYERYQAVTEQVITMSIDGYGDLEMLQTVTSVVDGLNTYSKVYSNNAMTGEISYETWYVDGMIYSNTADGKVRAELDYDTFVTNYLGGDPSEGMLLNIPESWFIDIVFTQKEDSENYFLCFTVSGDKYEEYFGNVGMEGVEEISDVLYSVEFDADSNLLGVTTEFSMVVSGYAATCTSYSTIVTDGVEPVTAPADADSYVLGYIQ